MSAVDLLADLSQLGIRLEADGDRLRFYPRSAATPELLQRMGEHKGGLLALLRSAPKAAPPLPTPTGEAQAAWLAALALLVDDADFPPEVLAELQQGAAAWCDNATSGKPEPSGAGESHAPRQRRVGVSEIAPRGPDGLPSAAPLGPDGLLPAPPRGPETVILTPNLDPDGWPMGSINPATVAACPQCGGMALWWPVEPPGASPRCLRCDPPTAAVGFLEYTRACKGKKRSSTLKQTEAALAGLRKACAPAQAPRTQRTPAGS